jgi:multiple sugar transport system permease protein
MASSDVTVKDPAASAIPGRPWLTNRRRAQLFGILLILPAVVAFSLVILVPLIRGIALGFFRVAQITLKTTFIGLENFIDVLQSGTFGHALNITIQYTVFGLILQMVIGVLVALLLNQNFYGRALARSLALFPYLVPVIVATVIWQWMLHDAYGIVNAKLLAWGLIDRPIAWFADPDLALPSVILVSSWRVFPFVVIAVLGRLQSIPRQLYDAARADGASSWAIFKDITLPQLRSVLVIAIFLRFIWDFNDYNTVALLTNGGPAQRTLTLPILIHQIGFGQFQLGVAAAIADLTLVVLSVFFVLYFWIAQPLRDGH